MGKYIKEYFEKELSYAQGKLASIKFWLNDNENEENEKVKKTREILKSNLAFRNIDDWKEYKEQQIKEGEETIEKIKSIIEKSEEISDEDLIKGYEEMQKLKDLFIIDKNDKILNKELNFRDLIKYVKGKLK
ncbi:MAG: hypothetical protein J6I85_03270 [Clostridia bacterium]|nr:hypothetical protein [Clostridia bacterium]MBP3801038.1 hypothetical protein [Clostridia bacterium]MBR0351406.1 hypothetical protein [Clostridia bacterium]